MIKQGDSRKLAGVRWGYEYENENEIHSTLRILNFSVYI